MDPEEIGSRGLCKFSEGIRSFEDPEKFRQFHRLEREHFEEILSHVEPLITKADTDMRLSINPRERLSISLRFLATGWLMLTLAFPVLFYDYD